MKVLYFDCSMGAAGDMLTAALLELLPDKASVIERLNAIYAGRATVKYSRVPKCGIMCSRVIIDINGEVEGENPIAGEEHHHHHTSISEVREFISSLDVPNEVRENALSIFNIIAAAESKVHGCEMENIHFHEVGSIDAMADVVNVCYLINIIKPEKIFASPIDVGNGFIHCAHGELSVPAPATEEILKGIPIYKGDIMTELCTPTGAAILKFFTDSFGDMPRIAVSEIGYGAGYKDFKRANAVKVLYGDAEAEDSRVIELACNLDDMTPEDLGYAMEKLLSLGALDVYFTDIGMKKCRPGVILTCMCKEEDREKMLKSIFKNTTTIGVREYVCSRYVLSRSEYTAETQYGPVRVKSSEGFGVKREKAEYEDLKKIADEKDISLNEVRAEVIKAL